MCTKARGECHERHKDGGQAQETRQDLRLRHCHSELRNQSLDERKPNGVTKAENQHRDSHLVPGPALSCRWLVSSHDKTHPNGVQIVIRVPSSESLAPNDLHKAPGVVSLESLRLTRGRKARRSLLLAFRPRVKQDKTLRTIRSHLSETPH